MSTERSGKFTNPVFTYLKEVNNLRQDTWLGYFLVLPATIVIGVIILYPLLQAMMMGFHEVAFHRPTDMTWVGLSNYRTMMADPGFWNAFRNSVILTVAGVSAQYILGLGLALVLQKDIRGIRTIRTISMLPWVTPLVVIVFMFQWLVHPRYGIVNNVLMLFGISPSYWLGDPTWAFPMVIFMHVYNAIPFYAIVLLAAMQSIPDTLYEAAKLDGASKIQQFRYITLPNLSYVSMILIVMHVIFAFNSFTIIYVGTGGGPMNVTEVLSVYIYSEAFVSLTMGYAAAVGMVMLVILLAFTAIYVKLEGVE